MAASSGERTMRTKTTGCADTQGPTHASPGDSLNARRISHRATSRMYSAYSVAAAPPTDHDDGTHPIEHGSTGQPDASVYGASKGRMSTSATSAHTAARRTALAAPRSSVTAKA